MTVVDTRRSAVRAGGRAGGHWPDPLGDHAPGHADVRPGHRPGALGAWLIGLVVGLVGLAIGTALSAPLGAAGLTGFVVACVLASASVRRGRALRVLVLTLPLVFAVELAGGGIVEAVRGGSAVTSRQVGMTAVSVSVLHAPWLYGGMLLAVLIGARRGLFARSRPPGRR